MKLGYARVSTQDQKLDLQIDELTKAGCKTIYKEKVSGSNVERAQLKKLLAEIRPGDTVIVWKLDRLGRSLKDLIELIKLFETKQVGFISLQDSINTTTAHGRLIFNIFASLAEFEKEIIRERTLSGLAAARSRGRLGGRPKGISADAQKTALLANMLYKKKEMPIAEICKQLHIAKSTLYKYVSLVGEGEGIML